MRYLIVASLVVAALSGSASAAIALRQDQVDALRKAAEALRDTAEAQVQPLPEGQVRVLSAVVMQVTGRSQWRPDAKAPWKNAAVNDSLAPGAMIRTGLNSSLTLRVGHNATVRVDRNSRVTVPQIVHTGQVLRTTVQVERGRADFKVDRVGLTNDFSVVTPSTTLAVRGTGYGVEYGGFGGTRIVASPLNELRAIEVTYLLSGMTYFLSGGATTTDSTPNPVAASLFMTLGPPALETATSGEDVPFEIAIDPIGQNPFSEQRTVDTATEGLMNTEMLPILNPPPPPPPPPAFEFVALGSLSFGETAQFICDNLSDIFYVYDAALNDSFPPAESLPPTAGGATMFGAEPLDLGALAGKSLYSFPGLDELFADVDDFVCSGIQVFTEEDLMQIVELIQGYCESQFTDPEHVELCTTHFQEAVLEVFENPPG